MIGETLKILVFLKEVRDIKIPLEYEESTRKIRREGYVPELNLPDLVALDAALELKAGNPGTHITLIHLGPSSGERWIREGMSLGCDAGLRIWDEMLEDLKAAGKALIFARVSQMLSFDLILTGNKSQDTGSGEVGILLANYLKLPCISSVLSMKIGDDKKGFDFMKSLAKGYQEKIQCALPLVATMEGQGGHFSRYASFPAVMEAMDKSIPCWSLPQIGIPWATIKEKTSRLNFSPIRVANPRVRPIAAPDSSLPAFDRVVKLLEGSVQKREGKVVAVDEGLAAEEIFQILLKEKVLTPHGPGN